MHLLKLADWAGFACKFWQRNVRQGLWLAGSITILISATHFEERAEEGVCREGFYGGGEGIGSEPACWELQA